MSKRAEKYKVPATYLIETLQLLNCTKLELGDALGVTPTGINGWIRANEMPKTILVACEALRRRFKANTKPGTAPVLIALKIPGEKWEVIQPFLKFNGCEYLELDL